MPERAKTIVVDGGSTDGTVQFLDHYAQNHNNTEILIQDGTGLYEAINQGIEAALRDEEVTHVGMLHSDDYLIRENFPDYLSLIQESDEEVFYADIQYHNQAGQVVRAWKAGEYSPMKLRTGWMPPHTSIIVSRRVYEEVGFYDPAYGTAADYEWIVRLLTTRDGGIHYFPRRTVSMRVGGASNSSLKARLRANAMDGKVWARNSRLQAALVRVCKPTRKIAQFLIRKRP